LAGRPDQARAGAASGYSPQPALLLRSLGAVTGAISRGDSTDFDRGVLAIVSLIFPRSPVLPAPLCCFSTVPCRVSLPQKCIAHMPRSASSSGSIRAPRPGEPAALALAMSKIASSRSLPRPRYSGQSPMADNPSCEGQGQVGAEGLRPLGSVWPCAGHHHVGIATAAAGTHQPLAPIEHGRHRSEHKSRLGQVRPDAGTTCTRR
jgi:hypothetical protein